MARQRKPLQPNREPGISSVTSAAVVPGSDWLELVVKVTALVAVVLPFVGAGVRAIAFGLAGFQNPIDLAGQDGVPDLGATAIKAVAVTAIGLPVVVFYAYWRWRRGPPLNFEGAIKWIRRAVILALAALLLLFAPPGNAVMVIVGFWGGAQVSGWARTQQLTFYRAAAIILVTAAVSAVGAGLNGIAVGDEVNTYTFASGTGLPGGNYVQLGDTERDWRRVLCLTDCLLVRQRIGGEVAAAVIQGSVTRTLVASDA